jgi:hypothetical protein
VFDVGYSIAIKLDVQRPTPSVSGGIASLAPGAAVSPSLMGPDVE